MPPHDYSYLLNPFHARLRILRISRSRARDELFLMLYYHGPCTRKQLLSYATMSRQPFYLNLKLLLRTDIAQEIKPGLFELTDRFMQHRHYMWCRICKQAKPFYDETLEKALSKSFSRRGFALETHNLSVSGTCPSCQLDPKNQPHHAIGTRLRRYILQP